MSDPGKPADDPKPVTEQDGDVPETVVPDNAKDAPEPEPAPEGDPAPEPAPAAEAKGNKQKPWFQQRIDQLTKERREAERKAAEAEARAAALEAARADATNDVPNPMSPAEFQKAVEAAAELKMQQKAVQDRMEAWAEAGVKDFGVAEFNEKCNLVAAMGADERPEFMQLVTDPAVIPDGHKVVMALADHPEEAQAIFSLPPVQMAARLTRFAGTISNAAPDPKTVSKAPAPIKPIGGSAKNSEPSDNEDIRSWMAKRNANARTTAGGKPNVH
jgi:hypothetical protein